MSIINIGKRSIYLCYMEGDEFIVRGPGVFHRLENAPGYLRDYVGTGCYVYGRFDGLVFVIEEKADGPER